MKKNHGHSAGRPRGGLNRDILLTLVFLVSAALLFGGFLFLRYEEQNGIRARVRLVENGNRLASEKLGAGKRSLRGPELQALAADLSVINWTRYDHRHNVIDRLTFSNRSPVPRGRLLELPSDRTVVLDIDWPGLVSLLFDRNLQPFVTVASPITDTSGGAGILVGVFALRPVADNLAEASRWIFIYTVLYGGLLSLVGYVLLRRNIVTPVKRLAQATEKVAAGDFEDQVPEQGPADIAGLARCFNDMVDALKQSRAMTDAHIDRLREANRQLQLTRDDLVRSEKMATVGHLAAGMAHELGNPLAALTGYLAVLEGDVSDPGQRRIVSAARSEAERMDRLVRDLLDYASPVEAGRSTVPPWPVVVQTVQLLTNQGALKNHELRIEECQNLPVVRIDPGRLEQVLVNLLLNARDADSEGGVIEVTGRVADNNVEIAVRDYGCGIDADEVQRIFEPFYTTKDPGKGRGLGLAVCQRILVDAGGRLDVVSTPGEGSLFTMVLPAVAAEERAGGE